MNRKLNTLGAIVLYVLLSIIIPSNLNAQKSCAADNYLLHRLKNDVKFAQKFAAYEAEKIPAELKSVLVCNESNSIIIPVAVHYNSPITCANVQCLLDAAEAQIAVLNEDFSASNDDLTNYTVDLNGACSTTYPLSRAPEAEDGTCVQFCLATLNHPLNSGLVDGEPAITIDQYTWPTATSTWSGYLNIFVSDGSTANQGATTLGISALPGDADGDGFWINYKNFGGPDFTCTSGATLNSSTSYNIGRTATHEAGHYFGLYHVFQGANCSTNDSDPPGPIAVNDTPSQDAPHYGCTTVNTCSDVPSSCSNGYDNFYSFMDYSDDECMVMFTANQSEVINWWANELIFVDNTITCDEEGADQLVNCTSPTCDDGIQNGSEIGVDCGGADCVNCTYSCGDTFIDNGGSGSDYFNYENNIWTICTTGSNVVKLTFTEFEIEAGGSSGCYDQLEIFDGASTSDPSMGVFCGETIDDAPGNGEIESTGNCMTIEFVSDNSVTKNGWVANITCVDEATCNDGIKNGNETGIDCGGDCDLCSQNCDEMFMDSGGSSSTYSSDENTEFLVCPDDPTVDMIELNFTYVDIEAASGNGNNGTGCWDILKIYDGKDGSAPMIGNYCGEEAGDGDASSVPANNLTAGMVFGSTDPSGCLFFVFESDASINETGWEAEINCFAFSVPVEFLSFNVTAEKEVVELKWTTENEINNKGFYIQRSIDGSYFEDIGFVNATEYPQLINPYMYIDRTDLKGNLYYRLKQMDFNGSIDFTEIKTVRIGPDSNKPLFYPNPTTGNVNLDISLIEGETLEDIQIFNKLGQMVQDLKYGDNSISKVELKTHLLEKGIYIIVLKTSANTHIQQVTKI